MHAGAWQRTSHTALNTQMCWWQDLAKLNPAELTPLSPEVISRQATINIGGALLSAPQIAFLYGQPLQGEAVRGRRNRAEEQPFPWRAGTIGHVAHGKSTVVKAISGVQTVRFKNELERNITIKLGYANAKIYKARDARVPRCARMRALPRWRGARGQ